MSDEHAKSLHEKLLTVFMARAEREDEIAAVNEINELRKRLAQCEAAAARQSKEKSK